MEVQRGGVMTISIGPEFEAAVAGLDPAGKYPEASIFRGLSDEHIAGVLLTSAPDVE